MPSAKCRVPKSARALSSELPEKYLTIEPSAHKCSRERGEKWRGCLQVIRSVRCCCLRVGVMSAVLQAPLVLTPPPPPPPPPIMLMLPQRRESLTHLGSWSRTPPPSQWLPETHTSTEMWSAWWEKWSTCKAPLVKKHKKQMLETSVDDRLRIAQIKIIRQTDRRSANLMR